MKKLFVYLLVLTMALSTVLTAAAIDIPTNPEYNAMTADELYELAKAEGGKIVVYCTTSKIAKVADKFMEEYSRALRLTNLAVKKYASNINVAVPFTHYWAKSAGQVFKECPGPSFAPLKMTNWLAKTSKAQGDYNWALAPHCYGVVNTKSTQTLTDSSMKALTGNYKTTKELTFTNLEVLNSYLNTSALKYKGKQRSVYLTECGASSGKISNKNLKYQAATVAYEYYKVAHLPFIKSFNYYRLKDEASEAKNGLSVGLLKSNGTKKPAYKVYKHIDTKSSQAWTKGYLKYISYKKNGKVFVRSGAGIVADSVPEKEYIESCNKARAVIKALEEEL